MIDQLETFLTQFAGTLAAFVTICGILWGIWKKVAKPGVKRTFERSRVMFNTFEALGEVATAQLAPAQGLAPLVELVAQIPDITAAQVRTADAIKELTMVTVENHDAAESHWKGLEIGQADTSKRQSDFRNETRSNFQRVNQRLDKIEGEKSA